MKSHASLNQVLTNLLYLPPDFKLTQFHLQIVTDSAVKGFNVFNRVG